jgi:hypothetical protein
MIRAPGIYDGMPFANYLADPCEAPSLSSSIGHTLLVQSALHAWQAHPRLGGERSPEANEADIGSVAHQLLLGGEDRIVEIEFDSWRTNASKEAREAARAEGKIPVLAHNMPPCRAMTLAAHRFIEGSELAGIFERGQGERTIIWREGDVWCRVRPDWLTDNHDVMLHYKTTLASARAEKFIRGIMAGMGYGFALRFYARGLASLGCPDMSTAKTFAPHTQHVIMVQEQSAPYACSLIGLTPAKSEIEDARVRIAIETWRKCLSTGTWPAYDSRVHYAEPTSWELAESEGEQC